MWYWNIHIKTLNLFGLEIQVWGVLLAIGVFAGWAIFDFLLASRKIKHESSWLVTGVLLFGLLGARMMQVVIDWEYYSQNLIEVFYVWNGGMASFGAIIFIFAFLYWYLTRKVEREEVSVFLDAAGIALMISLVFARIGCFLINDHFGKSTDLAWGIFTMGEMRHPISVYYMLNAFFIALVLFFLYKKKKLEGKLFALMMILYGVGRMVIDVLFKDFMGDEARYWLLIGFTGLLIVLGVIWMVRKRE